MSNDMIDDLTKITEFNMNSRYPAKINDFYKTVNNKYVTLWQEKAKRIRQKLLPALKGK